MTRRSDKQKWIIILPSDLHTKNYEKFLKLRRATERVIIVETSSLKFGESVMKAHANIVTVYCFRSDDRKNKGDPINFIIVGEINEVE